MKYQHIYLSPHYDDAALSCGGAIHKQTRQQEAAAVITIFAGAPDLPNSSLPKLAQATHQAFIFLNQNPSAQEVVQARRAENEQAMQLLGADSICLEQFYDCIYRGVPEQNLFFYSRAMDIFGDVHPGEAAIVEEICRAIMRLAGRFADDAVLYAPLAIGYHLDHRITHQVGLALQDAGLTVCFYEDYPYADKEEYLRIPCRLLMHRSGCRCLRAFEPLLFRIMLLLADTSWLFGKPYQSAEEIGREEALTAETIPLSEEDIAAKVSSVCAYVSQLSLLFESETKMREQFVLRCKQLGGERVWWRGK